MTTRRLLTFLGCVLLTGCSGSNKGGGADQENLQGSWRTERIELGAKVSDDESLRSMTLSFEGDKVVTEVGGVRHEGTFTLDNSRQPRHIDLKPASGNSSDKAMQGIYAFESDNNLRLCFSQKSRPSGFITSPNSDAITFELKRTPPREPIIKMTAEDLLRKCKSNKSVAADTYRNTVVQVTGRVSDNKDGKVVLTVGSDYIECSFSRNFKSELERVTGIKERQTITVRGTFNGTFETRNRNGAFVHLNNCEVGEPVAEGDAP